MNSLVHIPKNGQLQKKAGLSHNNWSNWLDDFLSVDTVPSGLTQHLRTTGNLPKVNIKDTKDAFVLELAAPGLEKSDFSIDINKNTLTIATTKEETLKEDTNRYTRKEFGFTAFKRAFSIPETVEDSKIEATYTAGILQLVLPKREEAKEKPPRTIEIS
jgi:HSP20 family protein